MRVFPLLAFGLALLAGCKLIDQTTFGARPVPPAPDQISLALAQPDRVPLVVIRLDAPQSLYAQPLADAVDTAVQRKPDVEFDIVATVPGKGSQSQQNSALTEARQDAITVMGRMADAGADPEHMHLGGRIDPRAENREVRVYVH